MSPFDAENEGASDEDVLMVWDDFLESYGIDDALKAQAYEAHAPEERACLKNAIAYHAALGADVDQGETMCSHAHKGYWQRVQTKPVPWTLVVCSQQYVSAARLIAACMPAFMAHVPRVALLHLGEEPCSQLLLAMELLGLEESLAFPLIAKESEENTRQFFQKMLRCLSMTAPEYAGRVIFLHKSEEEMTSLMALCKDMHIPYWQEDTAPHIQVLASVREEQKALLRFAQPDAIAGLDGFSVQAAYGFAANMPEHRLSPKSFCGQQWGQGMEGCFLHTSLPKDFFQHTVLMAGPVFPSE